jgi:hypothetical protein
MEQQIREKAIEFNQNSGCDKHPDGCQNWRCGKVFNEILHL